MFSISREVYEQLKSSIQKHGIGAGQAHDYHRHNIPVPNCLLGHAVEVGLPFTGVQELMNAGVWVSVSDGAVQAVNRRKGVSINHRITWEEFIAEVPLVPVG